jgi:radical SAM superfamily enzyme YgiQ (UPF0313 family)
MRNKQIIIINPPNPPNYTANRDSMGGFGQLYPPGAGVFPPLDVPYIAGYLAEKTIPIEVLEAQGLDLSCEQLKNRVATIAETNAESQTLAVVRTSIPTLDWDLVVCAELKKITGDIAIAVYGPVVSQVLRRLKQEKDLDYILIGEPEETIYEIALGKPKTEISGLCYRDHNGWIEKAPGPFLKDLDRRPFPKWELLPYARYMLPKSSTINSVPFLPMLTSRGCPFGCHYCPYPVGQGVQWRYRSPKNVVDEIEHLINDLGVGYIIFRDPLFTFRQDRVTEICRLIRQRKLTFKWKCETRIDCLNEETLRAMASAGCDGINFGIENPDIEIQTGSGRKPIPKSTIIEIRTLCRKLGINTFCFFIIGLPGDSVHSILETIEFAIRLRPDWAQFTAASPFIGTKLHDWAVAHMLISEDECTYVNSHQAQIGNENLTKDQVQTLLRYAKFFEQYLINRKGILKNPGRKGLLYPQARLAADVISDFSAKALFTIGRRYFERKSAAFGIRGAKHLP